MGRKAITAWCLYDWANSAFATTVLAALFPPFFRSLATASGLVGATATAAWAYTTAVALTIVAVLAPVLGAISDVTGRKKRSLGFFLGLGVLGTAAFALLGRDTWLLAATLFIVANVGFGGAMVFYESLLPHLAPARELDRISARGYMLGYVGGGFLLVINVLWVTHPGRFGMPDAAFAVRASFVSVALWWGLFSVPLLRDVPEPPTAEPGPARVGAGPAAAGAGPPAAGALRPAAAGKPLVAGGKLERFPVHLAMRRLAATFREIKRYRQLSWFLLAFWFYNDGIGTIIKMATAYGDEIGIGLQDMIQALIITQVVGIPFTWLFGRLADRFGAKRCILLGLTGYTAVSLGGYFMRTAWHFYILAFTVGIVQGGSQALSRSLFGVMVPRHRSAEFFGFFSTSAKVAGIAGPILFGLVSQATGQSRLSILSLVVFFVTGALLLTRVDIAEGMRVARAAEAEVAYNQE